jgi:hypothetical protein
MHPFHVRTFAAACVAAAFAQDCLVAQSWSQLAPLASPSLRRAGAMAFDPAGGGRLLMYGGTIPGPGTILAETWIFTTNWTQQNPSVNPGGRWGHRMVTEAAQNRVLTFGGRSPTIHAFANDTWAWTSTTWAPVPTANAPAPRYLYGMTYDSGRGRIVLFGGRGTMQTYDDTWELSTNAGVSDWTQIPATGPGAREEMALAYDAMRRRTVLLGGFNRDTGAILGDTWEYDGAEWTPVNSASLQVRYRHDGVYDTKRNRVVVYGGFDGSAIQTNSIEFDGTTWTAVGGTGSPFATEMYMAYDQTTRRSVVFGGVGTPGFGNQTWGYGGVDRASLGMFGSGCPTIGGVVPTLVGVEDTSTQPQFFARPIQAPAQPSVFRVEIEGAPAPTTLFVLLAMGLSNTQWGVIPLPFDLGGQGFPGCSLGVSPDALFFLPAAPYQQSLVIPQGTALINVAFFLQAFVSEASGTAGMTRPNVAIIGSD